MTQPRFYKDESGYCYPATPLLAQQPGMTPWDGSVDRFGFACATPAAPVPIPESVETPALPEVTHPVRQSRRRARSE